MIDAGRLRRMIEGIGNAPLWERSRPASMPRSTVVAMAREILAARDLERRVRDLLAALPKNRGEATFAARAVEQALEVVGSSRVEGD